MPLDRIQKKLLNMMLNDYESLDEEFKGAYLNYFEKMFLKYTLQEEQRFLTFLRYQIEFTVNKHILYRCLSILFILTIKTFSNSFRTYLVDNYFERFSFLLLSLDEKSNYSYLKIENILEELKDDIGPQKICELYFVRIRLLEEFKDGAKDNRIANCIKILKKCSNRQEIIEWLKQDKDRYPIKLHILNLFLN